MPALLDDPTESGELLRRLFSGMHPSPRPSNASSGVLLGEWLGFMRILKTLQQWVFEQEEDADRSLPLLRGFTHQMLAGGEYLLTSPLKERDREMVRANVHFLRDSPVLDFSDATPEQSERGLTAIFGAAGRD